MSHDIYSILDDARTEISEVESEDVYRNFVDGGIVLMDVREDNEWADVRIPGAVHLPRGSLELRISDIVPDLNTRIVLHCASGKRSLLAAQTLRTLGYADVSSLSGGIEAWMSQGLPTVQDREMTPEQRDRYSRHLALPQVGKDGQFRLLDAKVLLVGAGGLGSPAALYLAAAGVGTLGVIDHDRVDRSNLQRQVIHDTDRIGMSKAESARQTLGRLNPEVTVHSYPERLTRENVRDLLREYDAVVDGTDNFATRYLLNDASYFEGKPVVHGSIFRFEGQMSVFHPATGGPCYRCLFPESAEGVAAPNCSEAGVLGVLPGVVGLIQATETLKLILGVGESLIGRLLYYDALRMAFREFNISKDLDCPLCGDSPTIKEM